MIIFFVVFLLIIAALIILKDIYPMIANNNSKKDIIIVSITAALGLILALMMTFGVKLPSPIQELDSFVRDVLKLGYK